MGLIFSEGQTRTTFAHRSDRHTIRELSGCIESLTLTSESGGLSERL